MVFAIVGIALAVTIYLETFVWHLPDIKFHGRVVDQHGQAVSNAKFYISGEGSFLESGTRGYSTTDVDGYFFVDTNGAALVLGATKYSEIDQIAYDHPRRLIENDVIDERVSSIRFVRGDSDGKLQDYTRYATKDTAYIVNAWRLGEQPSGAIYSRKDGKYGADGSEHTLILDSKDQPKKAAPRLKFSCERSPMENQNAYGDWQFTIAAIDGGLQKHTDLYANLAPERGYEPAVTMVEEHGSKGYRHRLYNQRYYFVAGEEKIYGSLYFSVEPFFYESDLQSEQGHCILELDYRINPTGSRNLEIRPDDLIREHKH